MLKTDYHSVDLGKTMLMVSLMTQMAQRVPRRDLEAFSKLVHQAGTEHGYCLDAPEEMPAGSMVLFEDEIGEETIRLSEQTKCSRAV